MALVAKSFCAHCIHFSWGYGHLGMELLVGGQVGV